MAELLELRALEKSYPRGKRRLRVLEDVTLTVAEGEVVAVVGSRYEGKTTLLKLAAGFEAPDVGEVRFAGRELARLRLRERERLWREEIAWVSRAGTGLEFEVLDYVALALCMRPGGGREPEHAAMSALERVGVEDVARRRWEELSDWERVLVAFARGIAAHPRLMLIDDVLDGLGPSKTRAAGNLLYELVRELGCAVLLSASDLEAALAADRIWSFDGHRLREHGGEVPEGEGRVIDFPHGGVARAHGFSGSGV